MKGRKLAEEQRKRLSKAIKKYWNNRKSQFSNRGMAAGVD
jgi:ribosome recycling factor